MLVAGGMPARKPEANIPATSMSLAVTCRFVLLQHGSRSHFLRPPAIPPRALRTLLDVFVLPLLFCAHTAKMFFSGIDFSSDIDSRLPHNRVSSRELAIP
jgi:hypothetical protein